jgi:hypothetical protein
MNLSASTPPLQAPVAPHWTRLMLLHVTWWHIAATPRWATLQHPPDELHYVKFGPRDQHGRQGRARDGRWTPSPHTSLGASKKTSTSGFCRGSPDMDAMALGGEANGIVLGQPRSGEGRVPPTSIVDGSWSVKTEICKCCIRCFNMLKYCLSYIGVLKMKQMVTCSVTFCYNHIEVCCICCWSLLHGCV